jgi:hypothetical protein
MLDQDVGEQAALKLTVGPTAMNAATAPAVPFTISGLDSEDTGTVSFTDINGKTVQIAIKGSQTSYTANLGSLADGPITSSLLVDTDPTGNTFQAVPGDIVALDTDKGLSPAVSFIGPVIHAATDTAWPITISGLDDETGTLTFADSLGNSVVVTVTGNGSYLVNFSSLRDGPITSTLSVSDPVGNHWSVAGGPLTLVGTVPSNASYVQVSGSSTSNIGKVGSNGPTIIDATQTHGITFQAGNGPDIIAAGPNDIVYAGNGPDTIIGAAGAALHAGNGPQILYGAPGETMIAGNGPDIFAFEPGFGRDTITNFHSSNQVLQFDRGLVPDFTTMIADAKQVGANTVITIDPNDVITLQNVSLSSLKSKNFNLGSPAPAASSAVLSPQSMISTTSVFNSAHIAQSQVSSQISEALAVGETNSLLFSPSQDSDTMLSHLSRLTSNTELFGGWDYPAKSLPGVPSDVCCAWNSIGKSDRAGHFLASAGKL